MDTYREKDATLRIEWEFTGTNYCSGLNSQLFLETVDILKCGILHRGFWPIELEKTLVNSRVIQDKLIYSWLDEHN